MNKKTLTIISVAAITIGGLGGLFLLGGKSGESSVDVLTELKDSKQLTVKESEGFIGVTGEKLTGEDMKLVYTSMNEGKADDLPVYWTMSETSDMPKEYETQLLGVISNEEDALTYRSFNKKEGVEAKDDAISGWKILGENSETKNDILMVQAEFPGNQDSDKALAQMKSISGLIDNMNTEKKFKSKIINAKDDASKIYVFNSNHENVIQTVEVFN